MWWKGLFRRRHIERELEDEINSHLALEARQRIDRGESPADAYANSRKDFGNVDLVKETTRDVWGRRCLDELSQDFSSALRVLLRHWKVTAITIVSLSVAMGLGVMTFSITNTFLLLPPAAADPEQLVMILCGAISYAVSERRKEFGIRVALGAQRGQLLNMVLRQTLLITGAGVVIGLFLGVGATMTLRTQFYGISPVEWTVLVPVSFGMLGVSLLAAYFSARPWVAIDPMESVRHS